MGFTREQTLPEVIRAAARQDLFELEYLIDNGAPVNSRGEYGETALHWAAISGRVDIAQLLLDRRIDTRIVDCNDRTAAEVALRYGHPQVQELIRRETIEMGSKGRRR